MQPGFDPDPPGWARRGAAPPPAPPLFGTATAAVAVIGGGYTGLACALRLRELGHSVVLLEARHVGAGASGRNAGQWLPGWAGRTPQAIEQALGPERGTELNRFNVAASRELPARLHALGIDAAVRPCGVLLVAQRSRGLAALQQAADGWNTHGASIALLDRHALAQYLETDFYAGGVLYRDGGTLDPLALARGLARAACAAGVRLHEASPVFTATQGTHGWQLRTPLGTLVAQALAVCIDAFPSPAWPQLARAYWRMPLAMVMSEPLAPPPAFMPRGVPFGEVHGLSVFGGMAGDDGRFVASVPPASTRMLPPSRLAAGFDRRFQRVFPGRAPPRWQCAWHGVVGISADRLPHLCRLGPQALGAIGYSGAGIALAGAYGRHMADLLVTASPGAGPTAEEAHAVPFPRAVPLVFRHLLAPLARNLPVT